MTVTILNQSPACVISNQWGKFNLKVFRLLDASQVPRDVIALYRNVSRDDCIVRINSACVTSESFGDTSCDCRWQMEESLKLIGTASGIMIYAPHHEGRGIGLFDKVRTMSAMQRHKLSTATAFRFFGFSIDARRYDFVVPILDTFGISSIKLVTNNPAKIAIFGESHISVTRVIPLLDTRSEHLLEYLRSKGAELGHHIDI